MRTNVCDALLCKMNHHICELYQTNNGNISPQKVIDLLRENEYGIVQYLEQKIGCKGQDIINAIHHQIMKHHQVYMKHHKVLMKQRWKSNIIVIDPLSRLYECCNKCCSQYLCSKWSRVNFICRYQIASCPHTQEIRKKINLQINKVLLDKVLINGFTNGQLSSDLIQIIMIYYCNKCLMMPRMPNYLRYHYELCLHLMKRNPKSSAKFYSIKIVNQSPV